MEVKGELEVNWKKYRSAMCNKTSLGFGSLCYVKIMDGLVMLLAL